MSAEMERLLIELAELLERHNGASIGFGEEENTLTVYITSAIDDEDVEVADIPIVIDALTIAHAIEDAKE